jgi:general secretion pathway protein F
LDKVLQRLAEYLEKQQGVKQKIQQALIYPSLLTFISISIVTFLLTYVVPKIVVVFTTTGQSLPSLTLALLSISDAIQHFGIYALIVIIVLTFVFKRILKHRHIHKMVQLILLKIPLVGSLLLEVNTARFMHTFGMLFAASVPVLEAMNAANSVVKLIPLQDAIADKIHRVREGMPIHKALQDTGYFSLLSIRLIASGEMSGSLEMMLQKSAEYQDRMVAKRIDMALSLFEPMMILVMGMIVLFIVLAILLPIFEINQLIA